MWVFLNAFWGKTECDRYLLLGRAEKRSWVMESFIRFQANYNKAGAQTLRSPPTATVNIKLIFISRDNLPYLNHHSHCGRESQVIWTKCYPEERKWRERGEDNHPQNQTIWKLSGGGYRRWCDDDRRAEGCCHTPQKWGLARGFSQGKRMVGTRANR